MPAHPEQAPQTGKNSRKSVPAPGAPAQGGEETSPAVVNDAASEVPEQQRKDLDIAYYRDRLFDEMARLEEEREYLRRSAGDMDGNLPEDSDSEEDTADLASSLMDKEMDMSVEEEIEETLAAIDHALQKIEDGTYGICDVSGEPIPKTRLELLPWASLTAQMQAMAEGD